jgi:MFS transporter, DHA1 family, chloramphenicol resistance protein
VAIISVPALIAIRWQVPARTAGPATIGGLRVGRRLVVLLLLGALVNGATFCSFTYPAPVLTEVTGLAAGSVPLLLALFGLGSFAGVTTAGRYADRGGNRMLFVAGGILLAGGLVTAALNVGAALGPVLGGVGIDLSGYRAPLWVSAGMVGTALCVAITAHLATGRDRRLG